LKGYLDKWKVYGTSGRRYTLHVGPPQLIGSWHLMGETELANEVIRLELERLEVITGSSHKAARSNLGSDMDDVDDTLDEDPWDIDYTDATDPTDNGETGATDAQDYTKEVVDSMTEAEEAITHREAGPASSLSHVHHASPERTWMKVNIDVGYMFGHNRHGILASHFETGDVPTLDEHVRAVARLVTFVVNLLPENPPAWWDEAMGEYGISWNRYRSFETWYNEIKHAFHLHIFSNKLEENGNLMAFISLKLKNNKGMFDKDGRPVKVNGKQIPSRFVDFATEISHIRNISVKKIGRAHV
jgi:hypothetical protein